MMLLGVHRAALIRLVLDLMTRLQPHADIIPNKLTEKKNRKPYPPRGLLYSAECHIGTLILCCFGFDGVCVWNAWLEYAIINIDMKAPLIDMKAPAHTQRSISLQTSISHINQQAPGVKPHLLLIPLHTAPHTRSSPLTHLHTLPHYS